MFVFRLALAFGMPVSELLRRISSSELSEWIEYFELEPFGPISDEWRYGMLASVFANANRDEEKKKTPFQPIDFMREGFTDSFIAEEDEEIDEEILITKLDFMMVAFGGKKT